MPVTHQVIDRLDQIDRDVLALLAQRMSACEDLAEDSEEGVQNEAFASMLLRWEEIWEEEGHDPGTIGQLAKMVFLLCRKAQD